MLKCEEVKIGEYVSIDCSSSSQSIEQYIYIHAKLSGQNERETTSAITITFPGYVHGDLLSDTRAPT